MKIEKRGARVLIRIYLSMLPCSINKQLCFWVYDCFALKSSTCLKLSQYVEIGPRLNRAGVSPLERGCPCRSVLYYLCVWYLSILMVPRLIVDNAQVISCGE